MLFNETSSRFQVKQDSPGICLLPSCLYEACYHLILHYFFRSFGLYVCFRCREKNTSKSSKRRKALNVFWCQLRLLTNLSFHKMFCRPSLFILVSNFFYLYNVIYRIKLLSASIISWYIRPIVIFKTHLVPIMCRLLHLNEAARWRHHRYLYCTLQS